MSRLSRAPGIVLLAASRLVLGRRRSRMRAIRSLLDRSEAAPPWFRTAIYRLLAVMAAEALVDEGDHPVAAPLRLMALLELDRQAEADALLDIGLQSTLTTIRLAGIANSTRRPDLADRWLARLPSDVDAAHPGLPGLRGTVDYKLGRYAAAVGHLSQAVRLQPEKVDWERKLARARGESTMLDLPWQPSMPFVGSRTAAPKRGRILHLLNSSAPHVQAGYTVRAQNIARCQQSVGLDPRMVTRAGFPGNRALPGVTSDDVDGVRYERIDPDLEAGQPIDVIADLTADGLAALIREWDPALLHPTTAYFNAQVCLALGERFGLPVVYEVRGFLEETWRAKMGPTATDADRYRRGKEVETDCMRRASAVVTLSETMRVDILARGGIDPTKVVVIPNAVDIERFIPGSRDGALAASLGIDPSDIVVGYISTFSAYEGIGYLVEAVGRLRARGRPVSLLLVGDGPDRKNLEDIARRVGLDKRWVRFTGTVPHDDIERYYRTIDIFVVPRTNDRVSQLVTPLKPYEAMAMEKPIIVSAVGALLEIVEDGRTGRAFPPEDPDALAEVIDSLLDDPAERRRLGLAAREWVVANRTWAQNGRRYRELYERLGAA